MSTVTHVTSGQFEAEVLNSPVPVLVDFYATWCGPCQMLAPYLERLAQDLGSRARIVKVNVDEEPSLAARYQVTGVPTLAFFHQGRLTETAVGLQPPDLLRARLEQLAGEPALAA